MNDRICYKVISLEEKGITLEYQGSNIYIDFEDCANNYAEEKSLKVSKCIATRDITTLSFTFYTIPRTTIIFKRHFFKNIINSKSNIKEFFDLQKEINRLGYLSYDLS